MSEARCAHCPVMQDKPCLGAMYHEAFSHFCRWAEHGGTNERETIVLRSALGYEPAPVPELVVNGVGPAQQHLLLGDAIAAITHRFGADRLAKFYERVTGMPCGCSERQDKLNEAHQRLIRWFNRRGKHQT